MTIRTGNARRSLHHSAGAFWAQSRETAWDYLPQEAVRRAGRTAQLKGIIHEIAIREMRNLTLEALLSRARTSVTRSPSARAVDLVTNRDGRVMARIQAKDCISDACVRKVQGRVASGQYRTTRLVGTRETVDKFRSAGVTKKVHSSGVSSRSTTRAADNAGAKVPNNKLMLNNALDIAGCAGRAGVTGAVLGAGAEAWGSLKELRTGKIDGAEYAQRVVVTGGSNPGTAMAFGFAEQTINTFQLLVGTIDGREYGTRTVQTAGATGGAIGGAAAGAAIGSVIPGGGTVVGAVIGGVAGSMAGGGLGRGAGNLLFGD